MSERILAQTLEMFYAVKCEVAGDFVTVSANDKEYVMHAPTAGRTEQGFMAAVRGMADVLGDVIPERYRPTSS